MIPIFIFLEANLLLGKLRETVNGTRGEKGANKGDWRVSFLQLPNLCLIQQVDWLECLFGRMISHNYPSRLNGCILDTFSKELAFE